MKTEETNHEHYLRYKDMYKRNAVRWGSQNPQKRLRITRKSRHQATDKEMVRFELDCQNQEGKCKICGELSVFKGKPCLLYDHDHTTGRYRGAICGACNRVLGMIHEDTTTLTEMIKYLEEIDV